MSTPRFSPWLRVLIFGTGALIASAVFTTLVLATLGIVAVKSGRDMGAVQNALSEYALWLNLLSYPTIWVWLVFCRRSYDKLPVRTLGLRTHNRARALAGGVGAGVFAVAWLFGLLWLCGGLQFNGLASAFSTLNPLTISGQLVFYIVMFAAVGFMEEVIFRGYALHNFSASIGLRAAIWLQAILFAAIHLGNVGAGGRDATLQTQWIDALRALPSLALIGAIFALCWAKSGTLWYSIGFHAAWNFALGCIFSLPVSGLQTFRLFDIEAVGNSWINGGTFGAEGSVLLWPILLALWLTLRRLPDHPQALHDLQLLTPAPQVFAEAEITTNEQAEIPTESTRQSRFQTSMRAARETDEINISEFPILGQLPSDDKVETPGVTGFSHEQMPLTPKIQDRPLIENQSNEFAQPTFSDTNFQFQPLPTVHEPIGEIATSAETEIDEIPASQTDKIETADAEVTKETAKVETSAEEPLAPTRKRPTPRW